MNTYKQKLHSKIDTSVFPVMMLEKKYFINEISGSGNDVKQSRNKWKQLLETLSVMGWMG